MTKQFCDVCGEQIYGDNKFSVYINTQKPMEFDVCSTCKKEFEKQRIEADINTFKKLKK
jgi:ribosome-binding protein aMBF1 (putative translation factor)